MKLFSMRKTISALLCLLLIAAAIVSLGGCGKNTPAQVPQEESTANEAVTAETEEDTSSDAIATGDVVNLGEGQTSFILEVKTADGSVSVFNIHTDEKTVGDALLNLGVIKGEQGAYGLYVKEVNGTVADYDTDGTYWALYENGEYAMSGVDSIDAEEGATYTFAVE